MSDNLQPLLASLICDPSDSVALTQLLTRCLRGDPAFNDYLHHEDATLRQALTALFAQPSTPVDNLTQLAVTQVRLSHQLDQERPIDLNMLSALAADELCLLVLGESLNTDLAFEHVCVRLRRACLNDPQLAVAVQPLLAALALQAWTNEYIWQESDEETREVERSRTDIEAALDRGEVAAAALPLLLWSMYRPLTSLRFAEKLAAFPLDCLPAVLHRLLPLTAVAAYGVAALRARLPWFA